MLALEILPTVIQHAAEAKSKKAKYSLITSHYRYHRNLIKLAIALTQEQEACHFHDVNKTKIDNFYDRQLCS